MLVTRGYLDSFSRWQTLIEEGAGRVSGARWCDRGLIVSLLLFGLAVPHSIAAAQISYLTGTVFWLARNAICAGQGEVAVALSISRSVSRPAGWISRPLLGFLLLTILSSLFSYTPAVSLLRSRSLGLFIVFYLLVNNLTRRGAIVVVCCLLLSGLTGVGYSLTEKVSGRGMVIEYIEPDSPLAGRGLQPGDVIWMMGRRRVRSLEEARNELARHRVGEKLGIEALHAGDPVPPLPVTLTVTTELQQSTEAFGIRTGPSTRRFRISGFGRQFITYAEQMQLLGLLLFGILIATGHSLNGHYSDGRTANERKGWWWGWALAGLILFTTGLILTATRSVIVSFVAAIVIVSLRFGGKRVIALALLSAVLITAGGVLAVVTSRREVMGQFRDESTSRRLAYITSGLRVIRAHPVLGVGIDSHKRFWDEWGFPGDYVTHTHSTLVQVAMDRGIPALGCLIWLGVALWRGLRRTREQALAANDYLGEGLATGALAALLGFSLSALINYNFGDSETLMQLLTIVGAAGAAGEDVT